MTITQFSPDPNRALLAGLVPTLSSPPSVQNAYIQILALQELTLIALSAEKGRRKLIFGDLRKEGTMEGEGYLGEMVRVCLGILEVEGGRIERDGKPG